MVHTIGNEFLSVSVNDLGGALTSLVDKKSGRELLYQIDPASWQSQDVVIFPVINQMPYTVNSRQYTCKYVHGVIRGKQGFVSAKSESELVVQFNWDEESLQQYPFKFTLLATFTVTEGTLKVAYTVINNDTVPLACYVGGHPGLYAKEGKAILRFPEPEEPEIWIQKDGCVVRREPYGTCDAIEICKEEVQKRNMFILSGISTHQYLLESADVDYKIHTDAPVLGIWSTPVHGQFVCIEPWWGMAVQKDDMRELKEKEFVNIIPDKKTFSYSIQPLVH